MALTVAFVAPNMSTSRFKKIHSVGYSAEVVCTLADEGFVPHSPVRLYIIVNARHAMVRQRKVLAGFAAVLPGGLVNRTLGATLAPQGGGGGSDYDGFLRQMEMELCVVEV